MAITDIRIKKVDGNSKVVAKASVTFDNAFVIHGFSIVNGAKGLFVGMPTFKNKDGEYIDIAHPITSDGRRVLVDKIKEVYYDLESKNNGDNPFK